MYIEKLGTRFWTDWGLSAQGLHIDDCIRRNLNSNNKPSTKNFGAIRNPDIDKQSWNLNPELYIASKFMIGTLVGRQPLAMVLHERIF